MFGKSKAEPSQTCHAATGDYACSSKCIQEMNQYQEALNIRTAELCAREQEVKHREDKLRSQSFVTVVQQDREFKINIYAQIDQIRGDVHLLAERLGVRLETQPEKRVAVPIDPEGRKETREKLVADIASEVAEEVADSMSDLELRVIRTQAAMQKLAEQLAAKQKK